MSRLLVSLGPAFFAVACGGDDDIAFDVAINDGGSSTPSIVWTTSPARQVDVLRCVGPCPPIASFSTDDRGPIERDDLALVWSLYALTGVEAGEGAIESPVTIGQAPRGVDGRTVQASSPPAPLEPGSYVVRVVLSRGTIASAAWGIRWATFRVNGG